MGGGLLTIDGLGGGIEGGFDEIMGEGLVDCNFGGINGRAFEGDTPLTGGGDVLPAGT